MEPLDTALLQDDEPNETIEAEKPESSGFFRMVTKAVFQYFCDYSWIMLLVAVILIVGYYVLFPSRYYFHSDTTDTLMWAQASYDGGSLFNPDFAYACLLPFGTSLIMTALIPLFGVSMTTHVLGMLIFFLLFTSALMYLLRRMGWSWKWVSAGVFMELMVLSGSTKLREIFWGHTIYYSLSILFVFVGMGLLFRWLDLSQVRDRCRKRGVPFRKYGRLTGVVILLGIWYILTAMNQLNAMTIFSLPLMGAIFLERFLDGGTPLKSGKNLRSLGLLLLLGSCMAGGYFLTEWLSKGIYPAYAEAYSTYTPMNEWVSNLMKFPQHWFGLLGVTVRDGDPFLSADSIANLLVIISGVVLLVIPAAGLCCYPKIRDAKLRILLLTHACMTALIMMGYICGRLSTANWRLSPIAAMSVLVTVAVARWAVQHTKGKRLAAAALIPVVLICMMNASTLVLMPANDHPDALLYRLAHALEERGLNYGYATFWQANGVTVVSDSAVECRNVSIDEKGIRPYVYQSNSNWFEDQPGQEQYFLLLTEQERRLLLLQQEAVTKMDYTENEICGMYLWVFEENIFGSTCAPPETGSIIEIIKNAK